MTMKVFSWVGFLLIIPILTLSIGEGVSGIVAMKAAHGRLNMDVRIIEARLSGTPRAGVVASVSGSTALTSVWRGFMPMLIRPFAATRRSQRVAGD
jgi:hypothetical protein